MNIEEALEEFDTTDRYVIEAIQSEVRIEEDPF
jgi:hypothetical protein